MKGADDDDEDEQYAHTGADEEKVCITITAGRQHASLALPRMARAAAVCNPCEN